MKIAPDNKGDLRPVEELAVEFGAALNQWGIEPHIQIEMCKLIIFENQKLIVERAFQ